MHRALMLTLAAHLVVATAICAQTMSTVTVATKTSAHPYFGQGSAEGYVVDGVEGKEVVVMRGTTHTFQMNGVPAMHPFYISTSETGAGVGVYSDGVTGNFATGDATLTFTPSASTPDLLYYQCAAHPSMGSRLVVQGSVSSIRESIERNGAAMLAWPNPAGERATVVIRSERQRTLRLTVYDALGRVVVEPITLETPRGAQSSVALDLGGLASGAYTIHASGDGASVAIPLAVRR